MEPARKPISVHLPQKPTHPSPKHAVLKNSRARFFSSFQFRYLLNPYPSSGFLLSFFLPGVKHGSVSVGLGGEIIRHGEWNGWATQSKALHQHYHLDGEGDPLDFVFLYCYCSSSIIQLFPAYYCSFFFFWFITQTRSFEYYISLPPAIYRYQYQYRSWSRER